jgi:RNA polymerase sigma-32 factor
MTVKSLIANNLVEFSKKSKILEKKEEFYHIEQWREKRQSKSLQIILNSYLRLAVSYARKYKSYGLPLDDLIHEGVLGIMHALEKFDISKDFRLSTYASWWIRASIQDYILKNWSVVKTGSTASQKALFFNLRKIKQQISDASSDFMGQKEINQVSEMLNVKAFEIQNMESRLSGGDVFLNQKIDNDSENDLMSLLEDERANPEESLENFNDGKIKKDYLEQAISTLNDRERTIIKLRKLREKSITLDELGQMLKISKERVRQIETKALEKLKTTIVEISQQNKEFFI